MKILSVILLQLFLFANTFTAKVIGITDGDTIVVLTDRKQQIKIRLEGIDCPEPKQDFGNRAKQATAKLCFGKMVRVKKTGIDRYGRMLASVYVGNVCVNEELIRQGMAWHYKEYNKDPKLAKLEVKARRAKTGLWSLKNPVAPWEWRKMQKKHSAF
jgi:micrococcal nuclease